jgi:hypothetical protein
MAVAAGVLCIPVISFGAPGTLNTISYNFQVAGGGGGSSATFTQGAQTIPIEIFCADFANEIFVPHTGYSAILTSLTTTSATQDISTVFDSAATRDGVVTSWATLTNGGTFSSADASFINAASALERYQMAAYLVSTYQTGAGFVNTNTSYNAGVQQAIWEILDPSAVTGVPAIAAATDLDNALHSAANWLSPLVSSGASGIISLNTFLANYRVVSDALNMSSANCSVPSNIYKTGLCGGFQEQLTVVPEPRHVALVLFGLLSVFLFGRKRWSESV